MADGKGTSGCNQRGREIWPNRKGLSSFYALRKVARGPFGRHIVDHQPARTAIPPSQLECDACGGVLRSGRDGPGAAPEASN